MHLDGLAVEMEDIDVGGDDDDDEISEKDDAELRYEKHSGTQ